jgi:hypothetical protein
MAAALRLHDAPEAAADLIDVYRRWLEQPASRTGVLRGDRTVVVRLLRRRRVEKTFPYSALLAENQELCAVAPTPLFVSTSLSGIRR